MKKLFFNLFICFFFISALSDSMIANATNHVIVNIDVNGNNRIDESTIINYSNLKEGDVYNKSFIDNSLKKLYETDLFSNVEITFENGNLTIFVEENYLINQIAFEGNTAIDDGALESLVLLQPRSTFSNAKLEEDITNIINAYRAAGRYSVYVEPKIIKLDFNRVNLVYEINEGNITKITDINFIGNKNYSDRNLRNAIATKRSNFIDKIWGTGKSYDNNLMEYDKELLRQYYRNNGFVNFKVLSSVAELNNKSDTFIITFTVQEGDRYNFGNISITNELNVDVLGEVNNIIKTYNGDVYSEKKIEDTSIGIISYLRSYGLPFAQINTIEKLNVANNTIDIEYVISNGPPVYIERIDISGNQRTYDYVIRNQLAVSEGDALNQTYINKSIKNLRNLNFFSNVNVNALPGSSPDRRIIKVSVSETATGSLMFGAGYSSLRGAVGTVSIVERNLLGKGQVLALDISFAGTESLLNINFTEPTFMDTPISAGFDIYGNQTDNSKQSGYKSREIGSGVRFGFPLSDELRLNTIFKFTNDEIYGVPSDAAVSLRELEGTRTKAELGYDLIYNLLDNNFTPTNGLLIDFSQDYAGLGGDVEYLRSQLSGSYYMDFSAGLVANFSMDMGHIFGLNGENVAISDAFMNPGGPIRGFAHRGIGPRLKADVDGSNEESIGGKTYISASTGIQFPLASFTENYGIKGGLHINAATLYGSDLDVDKINDSNSIRTSIGASIFWDSPVGPLRFDFTEAINKETYDLTEFFQFSGGTSF